MRWLAPSALVRLPVAVAVAARLARASRPTAPVLAEPGAAPDGPVTVVVPARDEAARIGPLLAALRADRVCDELLVVDDESTDGTAEVARAAGARVVDGRPLPAGWAGKCWALQQGVEAASGRWVVCLDADTVPRPGLLGALVRRAEADGCDLVTAGARFVCDSPGQRWLHPAMLTTLVVRFGPPAARSFTSYGRRPERFVANGQCLVFRRDRLVAEGGWSLVRGSLVEDVALARVLARRGWRVGFVDATPALDVRMHDTARDTWQAWGRSLPLRGAASSDAAAAPASSSEPVAGPSATASRPTHAASHAPQLTSWPWLAADLAAVWVAQGLPLARLAAGRGDVLDVALVALRVGTLAGTASAYARRGLPFWLSPLADLPVAVRLTQSALRPERRWRGRAYTAG